MAHFAELDEKNIVLRVVCISNGDTTNINGIEDENIGISFCKNLFKSENKWIQTSYNKTIRKNYAGIGYSYNEEMDAFVPPKPYSSWKLNKDTANWDPPIEYPNDGNNYYWNEENLNWTLIVE